VDYGLEDADIGHPPVINEKGARMSYNPVVGNSPHFINFPNAFNQCANLKKRIFRKIYSF
jgi:hypothetical protein